MSNKNYVRYRFNVPVADASTQKWMDAQTNPSVSIRQLIRQAIERDGYVDAMCAEVEQLPKRGRPVGSVSKTEAQEPEEEFTAPESAPAPTSSRMADVNNMTFTSPAPSAAPGNPLKDLI